MLEFGNIPHIEREIFHRSFMDEISLIFSYDTIGLNIIDQRLHQSSTITSSQDISFANEYNQTDDYLKIKDRDSTFIFTPHTVFVTIPSKEYRDFETTAPIWNDLEHLLSEIGVNPMVWSFTKGNRWFFNKAIDSSREKDIYNLVLSSELLSCSEDNHYYITESSDESSVLSCKYTLETVNGRQSLNLKIMIASRSYSIKELQKQVFEVNKAMFDCWSWCVSGQIKQLMRNTL